MLVAKGNGKKKAKEVEPEERFFFVRAWANLSDETKETIVGILALLVSVILALAWFNEAGIIGNSIARAGSALFGGAFVALPIASAGLGLLFLFSIERRLWSSSVFGTGLILASALALSDVFSGGGAGYVGKGLAWPFLRFFDLPATVIIWAVLGLIGIVMALDIPLVRKKSLEEKSIQKDIDVVVREPIAQAAAEQEEEEISDEPHIATRSLFSRAKIVKPPKIDVSGYVFPSLNLLDTDKGKPSSGDVKGNANIIQRTLQEFGIPVEMGEVNVGPSVTQYTLKPAQGVKLIRIAALHNDLALALAAHPIRLETPIPGKSLVGIEVPNKSIALVGLRSLLELEDSQQSSLTIALGRDVRGDAIMTNMATMPHLLVAGSTGSGKSVGIHVILMSLLYKNTPATLKLLMIDPKRVELTHYHDIPHLVSPVITNAKGAVKALRWAVQEMEKRYEMLASVKCRDIGSYNETAEEPMPYLVVVIDELADLMSTSPREIEASIVRLAQMARAVGIHLIVSTQRPSVEVITGLIKANIATRIAFKVASQIDSRTILDSAGAEKLLGNGDMLFMSGDTAKERRIQGAYVSEKEVRAVTDHIRTQGAAYFEQDFNDTKSSSGPGMGDDDVDDDLYEEAKQIVIDAQKASASYLQRRLSVGYARAARLLDLLEEQGVIGPGEGAKPREVFEKPDGPILNDDKGFA